MAAKEDVEYTNISFCEMNETDTDKAIVLIKDIINQHRKGVGFSFEIVVFVCFCSILVRLCANPILLKRCRFPWCFNSNVHLRGGTGIEVRIRNVQSFKSNVGFGDGALKLARYYR
jgi:hypothetical protein